MSVKATEHKSDAKTHCGLAVDVQARCARASDAKTRCGHAVDAQPQCNFAPKAPTDVDNFINTLSRTLAAANRYLMELLHEAGIEHIVPSHGDILLHLFAHGPVTMQELAVAIQRDPSTVTALVRKLSNGGYVTTGKSATDRRVREVSLTEKGNRMRSTFDRVSKQLRAVQMAGIDAEAFRITCETLDAIRDNFAGCIEQE